MLNEPDLALPLGKVFVLGAVRCEKPHPNVYKSHLDRVSAEAEFDLPSRPLRIDAGSVGEPPVGKDVLAARVDECLDRWTDFSADECHGHHRSLDHRPEARTVLLVRV